MGETQVQAVARQEPGTRACGDFQGDHPSWSLPLTGNCAPFHRNCPRLDVKLSDSSYLSYLRETPPYISKGCGWKHQEACSDFGRQLGIFVGSRGVRGLLRGGEGGHRRGHHGEPISALTWKHMNVSFFLSFFRVSTHFGNFVIF